MSVKKSTILSIIGVSGVLLITTAGLIISTNAQTSNSSSNSSSVSSSMMARREEKKEARQAVKTALDNNDYEAWKTAIANTPRKDLMLEKINSQDKFNRLVEMHKALQNNDKTTAETIAKELGIELPLRQGQGGKMKGNRQN